MGPIQEKLESMAGEVTTVMDQQLQVRFSDWKLAAAAVVAVVVVVVVVVSRSSK